MYDLGVTRVVCSKMGHMILCYSVPFPNLGENERGKKKKGEEKEKYKINRKNNHGMISFLRTAILFEEYLL